MIFEKAEYLDRYFGSSFPFEKIKEVILNADTLPEGRTDLDGDNFYVCKFEPTYTSNNQTYEIHHHYADVHCILEGYERFGYAPTVPESDEGFKEEDDAALIPPPEHVEHIVIGPGELCVVFPNEPHSPCGMVGNEPNTSKKLLFKVKMD